MNKLSKGKTIGIVAGSLAAVALAGVGFSTWIINTTNTDSVEGISVTVADTKDVSVLISDAAIAASDNSVKFDASNTAKVSGSILSCGADDTEDLSFSITYKVTVGSDTASWEIKAGIADTSGTFNTAVNTRKYIALPSSLGLIGSSDGSVVCFNSTTTSGGDLTFTTAADATDATKSVYSVTQKFTFSWGEAFANKNPVAVTTSDTIYTQDNKSETASLANLTANTKAMKALNLSTFNITLSVGSVSLANS